MPAKLTFEYVKQYFKEHGCELLEEEYVNNSTKMRYRCSCGNISEIRFSDFRQGQRCAECGGTKKLTLTFVFNYFKKHNCDLLEDKYINTQTKMKYRCKCGNISEITFSSFQKGCRCAKCAGTEKHTLEYVKQYFGYRGCKLLEKKYTDSRTPMKYQCNCGNISKINWDSFKQGRRCKKCGIEKNKEKQKHAYEYVYNYFEEQNCKLLEKEYINNKIKMKYMCSCGNKSKINFHDFKEGRRCKKCGIEKIKEKRKHPYEYIYNYFEEQNCKLLEKEYINCNTKMKYICSCGNKSKITFHDFKWGCRCKKCGIEKITGKNNCNWNPNLTDEDRMLNRKYPGNEKWRKNIYKKDKYTCQKCNEKYIKLNAHHIEGYAENPDIRLDLNNGITFCEKCHIKFHKIYGKRNNNRQQLNEFLKTNQIKLSA